jgi:hypothetical protein
MEIRKAVDIEKTVNVNGRWPISDLNAYYAILRRAVMNGVESVLPTPSDAPAEQPPSAATEEPETPGAPPSEPGGQENSSADTDDNFFETPPNDDGDDDDFFGSPDNGDDSASQSKWDF